MNGIEIAFSVIALIPKVVDLLNRLMTNLSEEKLQQFLDQLEKSVDAIEKAKNEDEKQQAASDLSKAIRRLR